MLSTASFANPVLFLLFILLCIALGHQINTPVIHSKRNQILVLEVLALDLVSGLASYLLVAHLLAYLFNSFVVASWLVFLSLSFYLLYLYFKKKLIGLTDAIFSKFNLLLFAYSSLIAAIAFYRNEFLGNIVKSHYAYIGSITENHIYPPVIPGNSEQSMSGYHYAVNLVPSIFKIIGGFDVFQSVTLLLVVSAFLYIIVFFSFFKSLTQNNWSSFALSVACIHFTSFTEGFGYLSKILTGQGSFLTWADIAYNFGNFNNAYAFYSNSHSISLAVFWTLQILVLLSLENAKSCEKSWLINTQYQFLYLFTTLSFFLYFLYPTYWYLSLVMIPSYFIYQTLTTPKNRELYKFISLVILAYIIGKFLSFLSSSTDLNGIQALVFSPSDKIYAWLPSFALNYYDKSVLSTVNLVPNIMRDQIVEYHLFSFLGFSNYIFEILITILVLIHMHLRKDFRVVHLFYGGMAGFVVSFLFKYVPYPCEIGRFSGTGRWFCIIIILFYIIDYLIVNRKIYFVGLLILIPLIPAFIYLANVGKLTHTFQISPVQKSLIEELRKIHQTGDVMLDQQNFHVCNHIANIAGFYSYGGNIYVAASSTINTAIYLMNPKLIQELGADYVLLNPGSSLSKLAKMRLADSSLFTELNLHTPGYRLFKFNAKNTVFSPEVTSELKKEYVWALGFNEQYQFSPIKIDGSNFVLAYNRDELAVPLEKVRANLISSDNYYSAIVTQAQALPLKV